MNITIRPIVKEDNREMALLIKGIFLEFNLPKKGTAYSNPSTNNLYALFQTEKSAYWVAEYNGKILGGCGIFPTNDLPANHAELVKLYLHPDSRGKGIGKKLLAQSFISAISFGYQYLYLESVPEFSDAIQLYENTGFIQVDKRLGSSGHFSCNVWMLKAL